MKDTSRHYPEIEDSNHIQVLQKIENLKLNLSMPSWLTAKFPVRLNSAYRGDTLAHMSLVKTIPVYLKHLTDSDSLEELKLTAKFPRSLPKEANGS